MPAQDNTDKGLREEIHSIITAPMRSEVSTADIAIGFWSSTALSEKVHDLEALVARQVQAARVDELKRACENWELNPTLPATYMIDRTKELQAAAPTTAEGK